jgi:hypothetical protein
LASLLQIVKQLGAGNAATGIKTVADIRNLTPAHELNQILGLEPDLAAQAARESGGFFTSPLVTSVVKAIGSFVPGGGTAGSIAQGLSAADNVYGLPSGPANTLRTLTGGNTMGFFDSIFDSGGSSVDSTGFDVGISSTPFDFNNLLNQGVNVLGGFLSPQMNAGGVPMNMAAAPVIGGGAMVVRGAGALARHFPQLAAKLGALNMSRSAAYSMLKKFGPAALTGIGFAAVEVAQLASSGSGRRRMNICNGRALRRAQRRVSAFHNFYKRTCGNPVRRRRASRC